jgi:low affinity Fe/Cu permease
MSDQRPFSKPERKEPRNPPPGRAGKGRRFGHAMERVSSWASRATGSSAAFILAVLVIVAWLVSGPCFHYSDTWQLVINTSTTIVTFLMVFLIQRSQNKESSAIQLKLNELIAALQGASNHLISVEDRSEEEIDTLREHYAQLVELMREDIDITRAHSVEEAQNRHQQKQEAKASGA